MSSNYILPVLAVLAFLYPVAALLVIVGVHRLRASAPRADAECPTVSVVVSARNEMDALPACVDSVLALDYPADRVEVILVDDRSTDGTGAWLDALAARNPRVTVLHTERLPENGLEAKARGIAHGIARATGEWVLITDADARVPRTWARHLMGRVSERTALVGGAGVVAPTHWWGGIERASWAFLQGINFGGAGWRLPVVLIGPNIGIRRSAYVAAGGLERARFRIAEDLALFRMGRDAGGDVDAYADPATTVTLVEVPTPMHVLSQLRRWVGGALEQGPEYRFGVPLALLWGMAVAAFIVMGWMLSPVTWIVFIASKLAVDFAMLRALSRRMGAPALARDVPRLWALQLFAMAWLPLSLVVTRRMQWRGEGYAVKYT